MLILIVLVAKTDRLVGWTGLTPAARGIKGGFPLLFHGILGEDMREGNSPSWFNPLEVTAVVEHIRSLLTERVSAAEIGVVTVRHTAPLLHCPSHLAA